MSDTEARDLQYTAALAYLNRHIDSVLVDWKSIKFYSRWMTKHDN